MIKEITVQELKKMKDENTSFFLLDVREPFEYDICHLDGHLIPLKELPLRLKELNPNQKIVAHCRSGGRSGKAVEFLQQQGFHDIYNLKGGITAWINEIDPTMSTY